MVANRGFLQSRRRIGPSVESQVCQLFVLFACSLLILVALMLMLVGVGGKFDKNSLLAHRLRSSPIDFVCQFSRRAQTLSLEHSWHQRSISHSHEASELRQYCVLSHSPGTCPPV